MIETDLGTGMKIILVGVAREVLRMWYLDWEMNYEDIGDKRSVEGISAKALRQEESCRDLRKRNRPMWPRSSEGDVERVDSTYRTRSESGFSPPQLSCGSSSLLYQWFGELLWVMSLLNLAYHCLS